MVGASLIEGVGDVKDTIKDTVIKTVVSDVEQPSK